MKDSSGAVIHLVKLVNAADTIVTQHKSTPIEKEQFVEEFQKSQSGC